MMHNDRVRTGMASFVFATLLLIFNWPVMSIPRAGTLLSWLFGAWGLAIALLGLAAFFAARGERGQVCPPADSEPGGKASPFDGVSDCLDDRPGSGDV